MNWDYLAGFFDGEGSISFAAGKCNKEALVYRTVFTLSNNKPEVLYIIKDFLGRGGVYSGAQRNPNARLGYTYKDSGYGLLPALRLLAPKTIIKRAQLDLAIRFIEYRLTERTRPYTEIDFDMIREMRLLNDRSPGRGKALRDLPDEIKRA